MRKRYNDADITAYFAYNVAAANIDDYISGIDSATIDVVDAIDVADADLADDPDGVSANGAAPPKAHQKCHRPGSPYPFGIKSSQCFVHLALAVVSF